MVGLLQVTRFDRKNGNDEADVYKKLSTLNVKFAKSDPKYWFNNFERQIKHFGVNSQQTKLEALVNQLPPDVTDEVKEFLRLDEDEMGEHPYFDLKTELLALYSPKQEDAFNKANSRVLVGKPSSLAKQIINDLCECPKPLQSKCCQKIVFGMWVKNLPTYIKSHISEHKFTDETYKQILEKADKCWLSHRTETPAVAAIKAENAAALADSPDLDNPAVAALRRGGGRGGGSNRGDRGRGGQRGGGGNRGNRGGNRGGQGGGRGGRALGPKHPQALDGSCYVHHKFGPEAWSCADRFNCPMRDVENPRPKDNRNIPIEK